MRSSAQNKFTAVGRLAASVANAGCSVVASARSPNARAASGHAIGRCDAKRRRAAHHHVADCASDLICGDQLQPFDLVWQGALIE